MIAVAQPSSVLRKVQDEKLLEMVVSRVEKTAERHMKCLTTFLLLFDGAQVQDAGTVQRCLGDFKDVFSSG